MENNNLTVQGFLKKLQAKTPTIENILASKPLYSIRRQYGENGEDFIKSLVVFFIVDLCSFFNPVRNMNSQQVSQTAELIVELYDSYRPEDFVRCFKNIKSLKYGKFFEGIDGGKIIEMVQQYDVEREQEIIEWNQKKSQEYKEESKTILQKADPRYIENLKKVIEKKEIIRKTEEWKPREKTDHEKMVQSWYDEFDKLYVDQEKDRKKSDGVRFVEYKARKLSIEGFISLKFDEYNDEITA